MLILVIYDEKTAITDRFNDIRHITNVFFPDLALKVASGLSGFEEQPLSDKTLSQFRRCYEYE